MAEPVDPDRARTTASPPSTLEPPRRPQRPEPGTLRKALSAGHDRRARCRRRRRRDRAHRRRPRLLRRRRPEGARRRRAGARARRDRCRRRQDARRGPVPADGHAGHRRDQRRRHHRRVRGRARLRLPRRLRAGRASPTPTPAWAIMPGWGLTVLLPQAVGYPPGQGDERPPATSSMRRPRWPGAWSTTSCPTTSCSPSPASSRPTSPRTTSDGVRRMLQTYDEAAGVTLAERLGDRGPGRRRVARRRPRQRRGRGPPPGRHRTRPHPGLMEPRVSVITLGTTDVDRARSFYEAMGWTATSPDGEVVFMQALGMVLALWSRELLAEDSGVTDAGGWGGVTLAHNVASPDVVDAVLDEARAAGGTIARDGRTDPLGRICRRVRRPRRPPLGGRPQPALAAGRRRLGRPPALSGRRTHSSPSCSPRPRRPSLRQRRRQRRSGRGDHVEPARGQRHASRRRRGRDPADWERVRRRRTACAATARPSTTGSAPPTPPSSSTSSRAAAPASAPAPADRRRPRSRGTWPTAPMRPGLRAAASSPWRTTATPSPTGRWCSCPTARATCTSATRPTTTATASSSSTRVR